MDYQSSQQPQKSFPTSPMELRRVLESEHPTYTKNKKKWKDCLNWYMNEGIQNYIFQHVREKQVNYERRKQRAYFLNYVQSITDLVTSFVFSKPITRNWESKEEIEEREQQFQQLRAQKEQEQFEANQQQQQDFQNQQIELGKSAPPEGKPNAAAGNLQPPQPTGPSPEDIVSTASEMAQMMPQIPPELDDFWRDVDLRGSSIDDHMSTIGLLAQIFGHVDDVVDMPSEPEDYPDAPTMADQKEAGLRPYVYTIFPLDFLNWELDERGKFLWARWREQIHGNVGPFDERPKNPSWRYYTWTKNEWFVHEVVYKGKATMPEVNLVRQGDHQLGRVPVVRFYNQKNLTDPAIGQSAVYDMGLINIAILNWCSLIDEEVYQKCLNVLVMEEPADKQSSVEIGANNVLMWSGDHPPFYLAPASQPGEFILSLIDRGIQEIFRLAKLTGDTGVPQQAQSGVAYSWEFNQTNRMLADKADMLEVGEQELHKLWALWQGFEWEGSINYPDHFDVERFETEISRLPTLKSAVRSETFAREMEKDTAIRAMAKKPKPIINRVIAEIDMLPEKQTGAFPPPLKIS